MQFWLFGAAVRPVRLEICHCARAHIMIWRTEGLAGSCSLCCCGFLQVLKQDTERLFSLGLMDYSLLVQLIGPFKPEHAKELEELAQQ